MYKFLLFFKEMTYTLMIFFVEKIKFYWQMIFRVPIFVLILIILRNYV